MVQQKSANIMEPPESPTRPIALEDLTSGPNNFPAKPMTLAGLAEWLHVSRRFLEGEINRGRLRVRRISPRCVRILPGDVARWLEQAA
jgi:hypothetical protein